MSHLSDAEKRDVTRWVLDADDSTLRSFLLANVLNSEAVPSHFKRTLYDYLHAYHAFPPDTDSSESEDEVQNESLGESQSQIPGGGTSRKRGAAEVDVDGELTAQTNTRKRTKRVRTDLARCFKCGTPAKYTNDEEPCNHHPGRLSWNRNLIDNSELESYIEPEPEEDLGYDPLLGLKWTCCRQSGASLMGCIEDSHGMNSGKKTQHCELRTVIDEMGKDWQMYT